MEIQIDENWLIRSDELSVILCSRVNNKKGGTVWRVKGYFNNVEQALDRLCDEAAFSSEAKTLEEYTTELKEIRETIVKACAEK